MIAYGTKLKSIQDNLIVHIYQGYIYNDIQYYMVCWSDGSSRMLRESVVQLYFESVKEET